MSNKLFGLLSVVVLAAALTVGLFPAQPAEAQFASNDRSFRLRETVTGNVATPAAGSVAIFRNSTSKMLLAKNSSGVVYSATQPYVNSSIIVATTLTDDQSGQVILFDGAAAARTITLPEITASNIGMQFTFVGVDTDDLSVACAAADEIRDATDGDDDDNDTIVISSIYATATLVAINATTWLLVDFTGTVTHA